MRGAAEPYLLTLYAWLRAQVSRDPPPPLPGGYKVGEKVFYAAPSKTFPNGKKVVHGQQGEVRGPATLETRKGKGVKVVFPGNTGWIDCYLTSVRRLRPLMRHTRDAACVRKPRAGAVPPATRPNCKPLRWRQRWRGAMPNRSPPAFGECAQVSRDAPPALPGAAADQGDMSQFQARPDATRRGPTRVLES